MAEQRVLTSLRIPPELLKELKHRAIDEGVSLNMLLERGARMVLGQAPDYRPPQPQPALSAQANPQSEAPRPASEPAVHAQPVSQEHPKPDADRDPFAGFKTMFGIEDED